MFVKKCLEGGGTCCSSCFKFVQV